jgi:hypothetical protein
LTFDDGGFERAPGGLDGAASLAETLNLVLVATTDNSVEWERKA